MLGILLEMQQRLPEAERQYLAILALDSRAVAAANNLAWLYVSSDRKLDDALKWALVAAKELPDEARVSDTLRRNKLARERNLQRSATPARCIKPKKKLTTNPP